MFIQRIYKKTKTKTYSSVVLMENYREDGKVKHHIISNLSRWPERLVTGLEKLLKGQEIKTISDLKLSTGKSFGAILMVSEIAKRLGIKQALGNSKQAELAMFQIAGRIISQGSRNHLANEWIKGEAVEQIFKLDSFTEDTLYANLDWLMHNSLAFGHPFRKHSDTCFGVYPDTVSEFIRTLLPELRNAGTR